MTPSVLGEMRGSFQNRCFTDTSWGHGLFFIPEVYLPEGRGKGLGFCCWRRSTVRRLIHKAGTARPVAAPAGLGTGWTDCPREAPVFTPSTPTAHSSPSASPLRVLRWFKLPLVVVPLITTVLWIWQRCHLPRMNCLLYHMWGQLTSLPLGTWAGHS